MPETMETITQEDLVAALHLCSWKHLVLDPQSARELQEVKLSYKPRLQRSLPPPNHGDQQTLHYVTPWRKNQPEDFPISLRQFVGEFCSPSWKKQLTGSDLLGTQTRLLLKQSYVEKILNPLLTSREVEKVRGDGILVNVYDGEGNIYRMKFKLWGVKAYVLTNPNWLKFADDHNLVKDEDWITLWMFKHVGTHQLCFAIETKPLTTSPVASGGNKGKKPLLPEEKGKRSRNIVSEGETDGCSNKRRNNDD